MNRDGWDQPAPPRRSGPRSGAGPDADRDVRDGDTPDWESLTVPVRIQPAPPSRTRPGRRRRKGTGVLLLAVLLLLAVVGGGGYSVFTSLFATPDFDGEGTGVAVVRVQEGDSTTQIGAELAERGVVAGVAAFVQAAAEDERIRGVQPGYYQLRLQMSGESAVELLLDPAARVGQLEIRGGVQLDDTRAPDGTVAPGVLTLIAQATCVSTAGAPSCVSADELRTAMATTDPALLGVPGWALADVARAEPNRRLEGLLVPGLYDIAPGGSAVEVFRSLLATSSARLEASGLVAGAAAVGRSPYEVLTIASLVEKEAITPDMAKVARVIYNRLAAGQRLELDSMVNYPLDLQALRTTAEDRARPGPYNSYAVAGLPPTPIAAAGREAIAAALAPEPGPWFFFVRCRTDGTSCFAETFAEHTANVAQARASGAF